VDFLLVLIELYLLGASAEALRANRLKINNFAPTRPVWPKISGSIGHFSPTILLRKL